jgi:hypothetical protein
MADESGDEMWEPSDEELEEILREHERWVESEGEDGERADFWDANLSDEDLQGADLSGAGLLDANLSDADLWGADLSGANLLFADLSDAHLKDADLFGADLWNANLRKANPIGAHLEGADLRNATLWGADLTHATFLGANLRNADLGGTDGLRVQALARANTSNANLPEDVAKFDGLSTLEVASQSARKLFIALGLACAYAALAISTGGHESTSLIDVYTGSEDTLTLPFIEVEISIWGFHVVVPILLGLGFGYFHLQMQRVWEEMSRLPAVFPNGKAIDQKIHPWLITGLARAHVPFIRDRPLPLFPLQKLAVIVLAWGLVPLTQAYFVASFVTRFPEHAMLSGLGTALAAITIGGAVVSYRTAKTHLRGEYEGPFRPFAEKNDQDVRQWPNWRTVGWVVVWMIGTFALWYWWTFVYLGH